MSSESLLQSRLDGAHILYDAARLHQPSQDHFDPAWWRGQGRMLGEARGRGSAYFLRAGGNETEGGEEWVLRHYRRGGVIARLSHDAYVYTGLARSRPFRELSLLARLRQWGLPVPPPVAARLIRSGMVYRADLLTCRVPGRPLSAMILDGQATPTLLMAVGAVIGRFHARGVYHADLNAHNILVAGEQIHLIDFDRGCLRRPGRWQRANLDRLQRSLRKIVGDDWARDDRWPRFCLALEKGWQETRKTASP